jgi:hypothetical protein
MHFDLNSIPERKIFTASAGKIFEKGRGSVGLWVKTRFQTRVLPSKTRVWILWVTKPQGRNL